MVHLAPGVPGKYSLQLSTLGGYDSAVLDKSGLSSAFFGGQGALAKLFASDRSQFLLQDAISVTDYTASGQTVDALNRFSAALNSHINETWSLQASAASSYGTDSLRTLTPAELQPVGSTAGIAPSAAAYGLYAGAVLTAGGALSLRRQSSPISGWTFSGSDSYVRYSDIDSTLNLVSGQADYWRSATRSLAYGFYGVGIHQGGALSCSSGGAGMNATYRPTRTLELSGSAGPVSGNGNCGRTLQFLSNGSVSLRATEGTVFYISGDHHPNNGVIPAAAWITSVTGGVQHAFSPRLQASSDYAFTYGSVSQGGQSYQESYVSGGMKFLLSSNFWEDISVRHYTASGFDANPSRTVAIFTLWWAPSRFGRNSGQGASK